ncbi:MAG: hypothetical protein Q9218_006745 [Villophora microphyllina]
MDATWDPKLFRPTCPGTHPDPRMMENPDSWLATSGLIADLTKKIRIASGKASTWLQRASKLCNMGYNDLATGDAWKGILLGDQQIQAINNVRFKIGDEEAKKRIETSMENQTEAYKLLAGILTGLQDYAEVEKLCVEGIRKYGRNLQKTLIGLRTNARQHMNGQQVKVIDPVDEAFREVYEGNWGAGAWEKSQRSGLNTFQAYPWMPPSYLSRQEDVIRTSENLFRSASSNCGLSTSTVRQGAEVCDVYGVFATRDIASGETLFEDHTALAACA